MMKGVSVDPAKRTVRVGAGCVTGDVDHATHAFGLAVPFGIISTTGVAGLTLERRPRLSQPPIRPCHRQSARGRLGARRRPLRHRLRAENADLFWALRGGGGNFGVVTSFLFRTNAAGMVYGGPIVFELADAAKVMRWYRDFLSTAPDEFYMFVGLQTVPPGEPFPKEHWAKKMCALLVCHNGPTAAAEKAVNAIRAALPKPIIDWAGPMPYPALQSLFDQLYPKGLQWYWKGDFVKDLPDAAIDAHIAHAAKLPSVFSRHAPLSDRWRGAPTQAGRDRVELPRCDLVDGDRRRRSGSCQSVGAQAVGAGLLGGRASLQSQRRLPELHDGRRGRSTPQGDLRRQLPTPRRAEEKIRPRQSVPGEPQYPPRRIDSGAL